MMTTRGGGASLKSDLSKNDNPFVGAIVAVENWLSSKREEGAYATSNSR